MWYFWIRRQVRKVMTPIPEKKAERVTNVLNIAYLFSAWTIFGIASITYYKNYKSEMAKNPNAQQQSSGAFYGRRYHAQNLHMYSMNGLTLRKDGIYNYSETEEEIKKEEEEFFGKE